MMIMVSWLTPSALSFPKYFPCPLITIIILSPSRSNFPIAIDQIAMSKPHMTAVFSHLFDVVDDLVFVGHSLQGTKSHTSWEYTMSTRQVKDSPVMGPAKPETVLKMRGCAVAWWNETDEIVKCHDYSIWIVEKGEGEGKE